MIDSRVRKNIEEIVNQVAHEYGVTEDAIFGRGRWEPLASARKEAIYRCRNKLGLSLPILGFYFNRDHTTILSALRHRGE